MAELLSGQVITPTAAVEAKGGYTITIRRFDASGQVNPLVVHIPESATPAEICANPLLLAAVLKDGDPVWRQMEPGFVLVAALQAHRLGLDLLQGDIYPIEGRLAVSDKAKIKYALGQAIFSNAPSIETKPGPPITIKYIMKSKEEAWTGPNYETTVRLFIKGWADPVVYTTKLDAWFKGSNPNWRQNPQAMLEIRCYAKACERVCPVGTQPEEAPPLGLTEGTTPSA